jgi:hypothetical protein
VNPKQGRLSRKAESRAHVKATVAIAQQFSLGDFDREAFQAPPTHLFHQFVPCVHLFDQFVHLFDQFVPCANPHD